MDTHQNILNKLNGLASLHSRPHTRDGAKLAGLKSLLVRLGNPHLGKKVVHIAGTNGKTTTAAMIVSLLLRAGHQTGLYTSPHLRDIRERIQINGRMVSKEVFDQVAIRVLDEAGPSEQSGCSYFDLLTAIGLAAFDQEGVEWMVLEAGLGGVADATNAIPKDVCVLTAIGMDHMDVLGKDILSIARQKAGIVLPGIPVVVAHQKPAVDHWLAGYLAELPAPVFPVDIALKPGKVPSTGRGGSLVPNPALERVSAKWPGWNPVRVDVEGCCLGWSQLECGQTALKVADVLWGVPSGEPERTNRVRTVLGTTIQGRMSLYRRVRLRESGWMIPLLVLDGGHNREAVGALNRQLNRWGLARYTLLISLLADKMTPHMLTPLTRLMSKAEKVIVVRLNTSRSPDKESEAAFYGLVEKKIPHPPPLEFAESLSTGLALAGQAPTESVVVAGSIWLAGELLSHLEDETLNEGGP